MKISKVLLVIFIAFNLVPSTITHAQSDTNGRIIEFAGRSWYVKAGENLGPGPNSWSDAADSVWVDSSGKLHLKIRNINGVWNCAEIFSVQPATYGTYRFLVDTPLNNLDKDVVLGLFLYQDLSHEIDIEVASWGLDDAANAQFVVQPYDQPGHREPYFLNWDGPALYEFTWSPQSVKFRTMPGHNPDTGVVIHNWEYTQSDIPQENPAMLVRLNLWISNLSHAPANGQEVEVVITNVETPLPAGDETALQTQTIDCGNVDLTDTITLLLDAQGNLSAGNESDALAKISQARATLENIEADCLKRQEPQIIITEATDASVTGTVSPSEYCSNAYKVSLYALTDKWYVQPYIATPDIEIKDNCSWYSETHEWGKLSAHLVPAEYIPADVILNTDCPPLMDDPDVLTSTCYER